MIPHVDVSNPIGVAGLIGAIPHLLVGPLRLTPYNNWLHKGRPEAGIISQTT
jgi:hypothetical protein